MFDLAKIKQKHQHFMAGFTLDVDRALGPERLTEFEQRYVALNSKFHSRSGNLVKQTKVKVVRTGRGARRIRSTNAAKYAAAQDSGSGLYGPKRAQYLIRPRKKKALRFSAGGKMVFANYVVHPGVRPTRFLYNANDAAFRAVRGWLLEAMKRAAARF